MADRRNLADSASSQKFKSLLELLRSRPFAVLIQVITSPLQYTSQSNKSSNMFRTALVQSLRCASRVSTRTFAPVSRTIVPTTFVAVTRASPSIYAPRFYSASAGLGKDEVEGRIMDILKNFDKVSIGVEVQWLRINADFIYRSRMPARSVL